MKKIIMAMLLLIPSFVFAQDYIPCFGPGMMYGIWGYWITSWVFMIIFWWLIIWLIISLTKWSIWFWGYSKDDKNKSIDILKERFAKWEITKEQYDEMKKELEK
ncbi:MAG: hypothetical protein ACD_4C00313G0008 [uncultured bacterium (gcode 4)]|uniref:SHOCT domain-containing protein n=1 Tax=uncultured bacterium (gcode 4) TaxID=1234023 RepID=K2F5J7_9BACT|nr:MAG: hypothetical protein ACD_4C00313G0008 [uncultured bacterium (gcode 4)]